MRIRFKSLILLVLISQSFIIAAYCSDWPMWRHDAGRRANSGINLPGNPVLLWTRQLEEPKRCWPFQGEDYYTGGNPDRIGKLSFDISYEPVVGEGKLFVPSMVTDKITAFSTENGKELWRYYAGGPVRFAPVYNSGRVYFASDDGYLYCLNAGTGKLVWKYHGSYSNRMVLGNERIISIWPARGGPVLADGIIYFAAGVIPFEGVFIHAVDAKNGTRIWTNSTSGSIWALHQHGGAYSFGGPSPQGYLAISGDKLIVPGGRTPPAVYDRKTGDLLYYNQSSGTVGKGAGGYRVFASDDWFFNHGMLYASEDGAQLGQVPGDVITADAFIGISGNQITAHKSDITKTEIEIADRLARGAIRKKYELEELWKTEAAEGDRLYFKTGSHYVMSRNGGKIATLLAVSENDMPGKVVWEHNIDGEIWSMFAGNDKLFIVTMEGKIYCFGTGVSGKTMHHACTTDLRKPVEKYNKLAQSILDKTGARSGYGMIQGSVDTDLIKALVNHSSMHFIVLESDPGNTAKLRHTLDDTGIYGKRVAVINTVQAASAHLPYIYDLILLQGNEFESDQVRKTFNSLRPYGGTACFLKAADNFSDSFSRLSLENGELRIENDFAIITRKGALPGSAPWTHQYGGVSNRTYSDDQLVKPPLGTLWFGGPSNINALPRHHNGPIPQVAGGRLFILGVETISARSVYTGRELWIREIPGIGHSFTSLEHEKLFREGTEVYMPNHPGANFIGSSYVSMEDKVYIIDKDRLLFLDAATGDIKKELRVPQLNNSGNTEFGHVMVSEDFLIATLYPQIFDDGEPGKIKNWNATSSSVVIVMNRHTGEQLWTRTAKTGFRHNAIVAGNNCLYLVDGLSEGVVEVLIRRGLYENINSELLSLDLKTGEELWSINDKVFGTWLGLYEDEKILLQGGRLGQRGVLEDEPGNRLIAHNSLTGDIIWESSEKYSGPLGLHPDMIIPGRPGEPAFNPYTGEIIRMDHPVTGEEYSWNWHKYYGCGTMNSSKYLMSFRSGSAGFNDLLNFGGTANISGWKSGCTNNIFAADGILNGPDYTRTCTCSYPLQSSFGLVHMPDAGVEMWTLNRLDIGEAEIRALGINFGGQGNRKENGILWLEYPKVYDAGPDIPVRIESHSGEYFRNHSTWIENAEEKYNWVASYGIKGVKTIAVDLIPEISRGEKSYTVTLYFAEPEDIAVEERTFDVSIQGVKVLQNFDIVDQAGGWRRVLRKEFKNIKVKDTLLIEFSNSSNVSVISGVEIVMDEHIISSHEEE